VEEPVHIRRRNDIPLDFDAHRLDKLSGENHTLHKISYLAYWDADTLNTNTSFAPHRTYFLPVPLVLPTERYRLGPVGAGLAPALDFALAPDLVPILVLVVA
jgi:hypothetical protein